MAKTYTAEELLDNVVSIVDDERFVLCTREQYLSWMDKAYSRLWNKLADSMIYPDLSDSDTVTTGEQAIALPADCYQVLQVLRSESGRLYPLDQIHVADRWKWERTGGQRAIKYMQEGVTSIILFPTPPTGQTYKVVYVPTATKITSLTDTIDGVAGWEDLVVYDVAIKARLKEGSSVQELQQERQELRDAIDAEKNRRNLDALEFPKMRDFPTDSELAFDPAFRRWRWFY